MSPATSILVFAGLWAAQVILPGPNFVRVSSAAFAGSASLAFVTSLGTATGNSIWCLVAALGAAAVMEVPLLAAALNLLGAAYFATYACRLLKGAFARRAVAAVPVEGLAYGRAYLAGTMTALANPQAALFFATAIAAIFPAVTPLVTASAVVTVGAVNCLWYALVVTLLAAPRSRAMYMRFRPSLEFGFAIILMAAAVRLTATAMA